MRATAGTYVRHPFLDRQVLLVGSSAERHIVLPREAGEPAPTSSEEVSSSFPVVLQHSALHSDA